MKSRWNKATIGEKHYWEFIKNQIGGEAYKKATKKYWDYIVDLLPFKIQPTDLILDVGCGPAGGILLSVKEGIKYGLDPLMHEYTQYFNLPDNYHWVTGKIENSPLKKKFDIVFVMNTLDHVEDIKRASQSIKQLVKESGYIVILIWCHRSKFFKYYFKVLGRYIDPHHPHHLVFQDIIDLFSEYTLIFQKVIHKSSDEFLDSKIRFPSQHVCKRVVNLLKSPIRILHLPRIIGERIMLRFFSEKVSNKIRPLFELNLFVFQKQHSSEGNT
jgi:2-polyprenyl-6-hydroxyphenyl methylase/3-demethylubiquinone-9 3-methyltransferase